MAIFFFMVGLEISRVVVGGELRDPRKVAVPAFAAVGGDALARSHLQCFQYG
jgi:NhaA family Na+:H+ antiporter